MTRTFVISMNNEIGKTRRDRLNYEYEWFKATDDSISLIKDKMIHFWNAGEKNRKGKNGVADSYYRLFKVIYDKKIDDCICAEDDCLLKELPKKLPTEVCYLNGRFINHNNWKEVDTFNKNIGVNKIDYTKYRITGAWGIYFPKYTDVKPFIDHIEQAKRLRAIDVMFYKEKLINHYLYPSAFINDAQLISQIQKKGDKPYDNYVKSTY